MGNDMVSHIKGSQARSNDEWLQALRSTGSVQNEALADLSEFLRRAAFFYLRQHSAEIKELTQDEVEALAEDAAQEAAMAILSRLDSFRGEARFLAWAGKFGVACALTTLRKHQWRDLSLERLPDGWDQPVDMSISRDGWEHPELAAQRQEIWLVLREVVQSELTEKQRLVFSYILIHGVNAEVIADRLGISPGALYKLTHDARRKFKKALEQRGFSTEDILSAFANPS